MRLILKANRKTENLTRSTHDSVSVKRLTFLFCVPQVRKTTTVLCCVGKSQALDYISSVQAVPDLVTKHGIMDLQSDCPVLWEYLVSCRCCGNKRAQP